MDRRQANSQQLERERAVYRYLEALEAGSINGMLDVLQQAVYDATLDQMVTEAHQAYMQEEQAQKVIPAETDTLEEMPGPMSIPLRPRDMRQDGSKRHLSRRLQVLAALVIISVLAVSFLEIIHLRQVGTGTTGGHLVHLVCTPGPWQSVNTQTQGVLQKVVAISPTDAWAVGSQPGSDLSHTEPLIEHWDGRRWSKVFGSAVPGTLEAVAAVSTNDVWAVGSQFRMSGKMTVEHTLIENWDGQRWKVVPSPGAVAVEGVDVSSQLYSLAAVSATDVWAVGVALSPSAHKAWTLIEHWDGKRWSIVFDQGNQPTPGWAWGVTTISANNVQVFGYKQVNAHQLQALIERWDGSRWHDVTTPQFAQVSDAIFSLSVISANDMWAIGQSVHTRPGQQGTTTMVLLAHWDGQKWNLLSGPSWLVGANSLSSQVLAVAKNNVWVAGSILERGQTRALVAHWDGKTWKRIQLPQPDGNYGAETFVQGIAVSGGAVWVVGWIAGSEGTPNHLLIEQQFSCK